MTLLVGAAHYFSVCDKYLKIGGKNVQSQRDTESPVYDAETCIPSYPIVEKFTTHT